MVHTQQQEFELGPFRPPWELESIVQPGDIIEIDMVLFSKFAVYIGDGQIVYVADPECGTTTESSSSLASSSPDEPPTSGATTTTTTTNRTRTSSDSIATRGTMTTRDYNYNNNNNNNYRQKQHHPQCNCASGGGVANHLAEPAPLASVSPYSARKFAALTQLGQRKSDPDTGFVSGSSSLAKDDSSVVPSDHQGRRANVQTRRFSSFRHSKVISKIIIPDTPTTLLNHEDLRRAHLLMSACRCADCCASTRTTHNGSDDLDSELANVLHCHPPEHHQHLIHPRSSSNRTISGGTDDVYNHHHNHHRHHNNSNGDDDDDDDEDDDDEISSSYTNDSMRNSRTSLNVTAPTVEIDESLDDKTAAPSVVGVNESRVKENIEDLSPMVANSSWSLNIISSGARAHLRQQSSAMSSPVSRSPTLTRKAHNALGSTTSAFDADQHYFNESKHQQLSRRYAGIGAETQRTRASSTSALINNNNRTNANNNNANNNNNTGGAMSPPRLSFTCLPSGLKCVVQCGSLRQVAANYNCRINNKLPGASQRNLEPLPSDVVVKRCCDIIGKSLDFHMLKYNSEYYATKWKFDRGWSDQANIMKRAVSSLQQYNRQPLNDTKSHQMLVNNLNAVINNPGIQTPASLSPPMSY